MMTFKDILTDQPEYLQNIANEVRKLILKTDESIEENIYGGAKVKMSLYSIGGTDNVLYGIGFGKDHVKLYLHHTDKPGADTTGLKLEGKGKHARTVKIKELDKTLKQHLSAAFNSLRTASGY